MEEKKKQYEKPTAQMIRFMYRDQVVAASGKCSLHANGDYNSSYAWYCKEPEWNLEH